MACEQGEVKREATREGDVGESRPAGPRTGSHFFFFLNKSNGEDTLMHADCKTQGGPLHRVIVTLRVSEGREALGVLFQHRLQFLLCDHFKNSTIHRVKALKTVRRNINY